MRRVELRALTVGDAPACDAVIASLPYFFGDPDGVRVCAEAVRSQRGFVATSDGDVAGFITLEQHDPASAEITWLAVHAEHRRGGIGRRLVAEAVRALGTEGVEMLFVLTLGPSVPEPGVEDGYAGTRAFYRALGFVPLREFALRTWNDPAALVMAKAL